MKKVFLAFIVLLSFAESGLCSVADSLSAKLHVGITSGYNQNSSFSHDLYVGMVFPLQDNLLEANMGYAYFNNTTHYAGVKGLRFQSHGVYGEGNYFLTPKFYAGARFSVNLNWVDRDSQRLFDKINTDAPTFFSGIAALGQIGFKQNITDKIGLKIQSQFGIHNYKIAEGAVYIDNSDSPLRDAQKGIELHAEFLYNLGLGIQIKL